MIVFDRPMARLAASTFFAALLTVASTAPAAATVLATDASTAPAGSSANAAIRALLNDYEAALNKEDTARVLEYFTDDAAVLAPNSPTAVGREAVGKLYDEVFGAVAFDIKFTIAELVELSPDSAYFRSTSNGTVMVRASGAVVPAAYHELFVLSRTPKGEWKIARYSFSSTNPPPK